MQGATIEQGVRPRVRVLFPMAFALALLAFILHLVALEFPRFDLAPWIEGQKAEGPVGIAFDRWLDSGGFRIYALPALVGLVAVLAFLAFDALLRSRLERPYEVAALLPVLIWLVLPGQAALHRVHGGESWLLGMGIFFLGANLIRVPARAAGSLGVVLALSSVAVHPGMLLWQPFAALLFVGRLGRLRGAWIVALFLLAVGFAIVKGVLAVSIPTASVDPSLDASRFGLALKQAAAAPFLAADPRLRELLPTGFDGLRGHWPVALGLVFWLVLVGWVALLAGIAETAYATAMAGLILIGGPYLAPAWVPGEKAPLVAALLPAGWILALLLARIGGQKPRLVMLGAAVGLAALGVIWTFDLRQSGKIENRQRKLESRHTTLEIPRRRLAPGAEPLAPELERDPARLLLYVEDLAKPGRDAEALVFAAGDAALRRLSSDAAGVIRADFVRDRLKSRLNHQDAIPLTATEVDRALFPKLQGLESRLTELRNRIHGAGVLTSFPVAVREAQEMIPEALEVCLSGGSHPRITTFGQMFFEALRHLGDAADHLGQVRDLVPLREAVVELSARQPRQVALLARALTDSGRPKDAQPLFAEAFKAINAREGADIFWLIHRLVSGVADAKAGSEKEGLASINRAWSDLARGGVERVFDSIRPEGLEFWIVAEVLLVRADLTKRLDKDFFEQAHHDLDSLLQPTLSFGLKRVPALSFRGKLRAIAGELAPARQDLRELLGLEVTDPVEKSTGQRGRLDFPRWRRLGLETLKEVGEGQLQEPELERIRVQLAALEGQ